jgi:hypothetical protein
MNGYSMKKLLFSLFLGSSLISSIPVKAEFILTKIDAKVSAVGEKIGDAIANAISKVINNTPLKNIKNIDLEALEAKITSLINQIPTDDLTISTLTSSPFYVGALYNKLKAVITYRMNRNIYNPASSSIDKNGNTVTIYDYSQYNDLYHTDCGEYENIAKILLAIGLVWNTWFYMGLKLKLHF